MRLLRGIGGLLLWLLALVLAVVALVLCVTVLLLPLGLPLLGYARRLFTFSLRLMFPGTAARSSDLAAKTKAAVTSRGRSSGPD